MLVFGIFNTINDFMVLALPIPIVWKLQLPIKQRIAVISIFSISFFACIAGIIRVAYSKVYVQSYDQSWDSYGMGLAAGIELNLGVVRFFLCSFFNFVPNHIPIKGSLSMTIVLDLRIRPRPSTSIGPLLSQSLGIQP